MVKSSSVLTRTDRGQPIAFRIDTANSDGTIKSVRKVRDYDIKGNIVSETDYVWNDNGEALSAQLSRSEMQYDDTGHIIEVKITEGEETRFYKYSYESLGDGRTVVTRKSFTGELEEISERLEFDKNGKQISYSTRLAPDAKEIATKWKKVSE